jgi:uncharacterized protein YbjT (DUF2867 family)
MSIHKRRSIIVNPTIESNNGRHGRWLHQEQTVEESMTMPIAGFHGIRNGKASMLSETQASGATTLRDQPTLVLGGTGKTGRRVAERLVARGVPVRVGSRSGEPPFDWENRDTWAPALRHMKSAYVSYYPDLAIPGAVGAVRELVEIAEEHGVRRLVLLSGRGEDEAQRTEEVVQASGTDWTIVRSSWFNQNFSENYLLDAVLSGEVLLPAQDVGEPFIDADDIADVVAAALTENGHVGQLYEVTGPRLLTFPEAVAEIAAATGREIRYGHISPEKYAAVLAAEGVPADFILLVTYLFTTVLDGRNAQVKDGVRQALGREPRDFSDYARATAATGVWGAPTMVAAR